MLFDPLEEELYLPAVPPAYPCSRVASAQCSNIVMPSNEAMRPIHERMQTIIAPAHYDLWLDSRITDKQEIMQYLTSAPSSQLAAYPVSTWVNSPKNNDERCIQPVNQ